MRPKSTLGLALSFVLAWSQLAGAARPPVVVELRQDTPEIDPAALRDAASRELDAPVLVEAAPGASPPAVTVSIDRVRGELVVARRGAAGALERRIALPADPADTLRTAVFLIGNLARDEASELLGELRPAAPPSAAPSTELPVSGPAEATALRPPAPPARRLLWVGASVEGDMALLPSSTDTCALSAVTALPSSDYVCVLSDGRPYPRRNDHGAENSSITLGRSDQIQGGVHPANARLLVAIDFAVDDHVLLGARLGFATSTYPGGPSPGAPTNGFGHLHFEARASYVLGARPLATTGVFPMLALGVGAAEHSASVSVTVFEGNAQVNPSAWQVAGPAFASVGGGVRWAPSSALAFGILQLKATLAFGAQAPLVLLSPEISAQVGF